jgi:serine/threonine protein kinase
MNACPYCGQSVAPSDMTCPACGSPLAGFGLPERTLLEDGKIQLEGVLGQGGFGITYSARSVALGIPVAVKEFFPEGSTRRGTQLVPPTTLMGQGFGETKDRFLEEAQLLARFQHPGVVRVYDAFSENNTAYLVMERLEGETLLARLTRVRTLPPREVESLALEVLDALLAVHVAGLLHRDLKPDNVFLTTDGRAVLIDFGSARGFTSTKTVQHTRLVTPGYAAPEQYASSARFGPYTDLYGLAATLFHAATGQMPPSATDRFVGTPLPELPPNLGAGLRNAIERGLQLNVAERPQSVRDFLWVIQSASQPGRSAGSSSATSSSAGSSSTAYTDSSKTVRVDTILPPSTLGPRPSRSRTPVPKSSSAGPRVPPNAERVIYRAGNVILTTHYLTVGAETVPLSQFSRVDLERSFSQSAQIGSYGCVGCMGVLLLLVVPPFGAFLIVVSVIAAFVSRVARREVYHVSLRGPQGRVRVMGTADKSEAEALLQELIKIV